MAGRPKGLPKTGGRPKGGLNKNSTELKDMIRGALDDAGGRKYLAEQAILNPAAFLGLVGKILPRDMNVTGDVPFIVKIVKFSDDAGNPNPE